MMVLPAPYETVASVLILPRILSVSATIIARCEAVNCRLLVVEAKERYWFDVRRHARAVAVAAIEGGASPAATSCATQTCTAGANEPKKDGK